MYVLFFWIYNTPRISSLALKRYLNITTYSNQHDFSLTGRWTQASRGRTSKEHSGGTTKASRVQGEDEERSAVRRHAVWEQVEGRPRAQAGWLHIWLARQRQRGTQGRRVSVHEITTLYICDFLGIIGIQFIRLKRHLYCQIRIKELTSLKSYIAVTKFSARFEFIQPPHDSHRAVAH